MGVEDDKLIFLGLHRVVRMKDVQVLQIGELVY